MPTDLAKELTAKLQLIPDYAQMRAHIVRVIDSCTRGPSPMMIGNLNEEASNRDASCDEFVGSEEWRMVLFEKNKWRESLHQILA